MINDQKRKSDYGWFALFAACTICFSLVQDTIRPQFTGAHNGFVYLLGVLPNFFPTVGLPALFIVVLPYFSSESKSKWIHENIYITAMVISAGGLITWEFLQFFTSNGYFDLLE